MAAAGARIWVPVVVACRVLGLSTQGYYQWLKAPDLISGMQPFSRPKPNACGHSWGRLLLPNRRSKISPTASLPRSIKNARVLTPGSGAGIPGNGMHWRGRLTEVSGWAFGLLSAGD